MRPMNFEQVRCTAREVSLHDEEVMYNRPVAGAAPALPFSDLEQEVKVDVGEKDVAVIMNR